jgi:hypothetical protein
MWLVYEHERSYLTAWTDDEFRDEFETATANSLMVRIEHVAAGEMACLDDVTEFQAYIRCNQLLDWTPVSVPRTCGTGHGHHLVAGRCRGDHR